MVGKLSEIVTAAVVADNIKPSSQSEKVQAAKTAKNQDDSLFQKDEQESFHIERGSFDEETVDFMTKELNKLMNKVSYNLQFDYHKFEDVMSVQMIDKETDEVIKEMPPEEVVENIMRAKVWLGAFIDKAF